MNVYALGASRNIGYHAAIRLLDKGATVTFLLRTPSAFDNDAKVQHYIQEGKAVLVPGDALNTEDVARGWEISEQASPSGRIDTILFTIGQNPNQKTGFSLFRGVKLQTSDLCTRSLANILHGIRAHSSPTKAQPKVICISSVGVTTESFRNQPWLLRLIFGYLLQEPFADKLGYERLCAYIAGWEWSDVDKVDPRILSPGWEDQFKIERDGGEIRSGWLKDLVLLRPAMLTNGDCQADLRKDSKKEPYRVKEGDLGGAWTISRQDVAHFIVEGVLHDWPHWQGKRVSIAY